MPTTATQDRLALRLTEADGRMLAIVAAHLQRTRKTPFVSPADTVRAALVIAAEKIATAPDAQPGR